MADSIDPTATRDYRPKPAAPARGPVTKTPISVTGQEYKPAAAQDQVDIKGAKPLLTPEEMQKYVQQLMEMGDSPLPGRENIVADAAYRYENGLYPPEVLRDSMEGLLDDLRPLFDDEGPGRLGGDAGA